MRAFFLFVSVDSSIWGQPLIFSEYSVSLYLSWLVVIVCLVCLVFGTSLRFNRLVVAICLYTSSPLSSFWSLCASSALSYVCLRVSARLWLLFAYVLRLLCHVCGHCIPCLPCFLYVSVFELSCGCYVPMCFVFFV